MERHQEDWIDGPLSVRSNRYGEDVIVVSLGGELDRSNVATAKAVLVAAAREAAPLLVIDLKRVVPSPAPEVTRMLDLIGIDSLIRPPTAADEAAA